MDDHDGVEHHVLRAMALERRGDGPDARRVEEHADLDGAGPQVDEDGVDLLRQERGWKRSRSPDTPRLFCAVPAASAVAPWTPWAANVSRSAWMPAPPPESEVAIDTAVTGRNRRTRGGFFIEWRSYGRRRAPDDHARGRRAA